MDKFAKYFISNDQKTFFLENINLLLSTGISTSTALKSIEKTEKNAQMKTIIKQIVNDVEEGISLSKAVNNTEVFEKYIVDLIELGEKTGTLSKTLDLLIEERAKSEELKQKTRSAMLYPSIILSMSFIVAILISWFMLPKLSTIFTSLHIQLPLITKIVLNIGIFLSIYGKIFIPLLILYICLGCFKLITSNPTT